MKIYPFMSDCRAWKARVLPSRLGSTHQISKSTPCFQKPNCTKNQTHELKLEANSRFPLIFKKVGILLLILPQVKFGWINVNSTARNTVESLWKEGIILMYFFFWINTTLINLSSKSHPNLYHLSRNLRWQTRTQQESECEQGKRSSWRALGIIKVSGRDTGHIPDTLQPPQHHEQLLETTLPPCCIWGALTCHF